MTNTLQRYKPIPPLSELKPGIKAGWKYQCLILQAEPDDKIGSIIISSGTKDDETGASVLARLIDVSPTAFKDADWEAHSSDPPYKAGDLIYTKRYPAGARLKGADGRDYLMVADTEIIGFYEQDAWAEQRSERAA